MLHFLKPMLRSSSYLRRVENSLVHLVEHGRVFTPGPSPGNPYAIQFQGATERIA